MRTDLILFGKRIDLASQIRRRRFVGAAYTGLALLVMGGWFLDHWRVWSSCLIIVAASYVGKQLFGGFGVSSGGMIKPFLGNAVRARYVQNPNSRWSQLARSAIPNLAERREFCSDEREVQSRDSAHEVAYRRLGAVVVFTFSIALLKNSVPSLLLPVGIAIPPQFFDETIYGLLIASYILVVTLPQAIMLWTEPDMEEPK